MSDSWKEKAAKTSKWLKDNINLNKREKLLSEHACKSKDAIRLETSKKGNDNGTNNWLSPYSADIDKIINNVFYNRYADKTQVFSFMENDDITRRATHVQYVARIAYKIGDALNLNTDLIQAIALGHDTGHTPFGHAGEEYLSDLYYKHAQKYFNHNVHSVHALKDIAWCNLTIQTYDGILYHNGEDIPANGELKPDIKRKTLWRDSESAKNALNNELDNCYTKRIKILDKNGREKQKAFYKDKTAATLEGCVVRVSDILAYVYKDRQDALKCKYLQFDDVKQLARDEKPDITPAWLIVPTITNDIIMNSYGKDYIKISPEYCQLLSDMKDHNNDRIYKRLDEIIENPVKHIIETVYEKERELLLKAGNDIEKIKDTAIFKHHLSHPLIIQSNFNSYNSFMKTKDPKVLEYRFDLEKKVDDLVVDYIASMTDDYLIQIYKKLVGEKDDYYKKAMQLYDSNKLF